MMHLQAIKNKVHMLVNLISICLSCTIISCRCNNDPLPRNTNTKPALKGNTTPQSKPTDESYNLRKAELNSLIEMNKQLTLEDIQRARLLISKLDKPQVKEKYNDGMNILGYAASNNKPEIVQLLVERIAEVDRTELNIKSNSDKYTPLHQILVNIRTAGIQEEIRALKSIKVAKLLIEKLDVAELAEQDKWGNTPLHYAIKCDVGLSIQLIQKIASVDKLKLNLENKDKETPLSLAKQTGDKALEKLLEEKLAS